MDAGTKDSLGPISPRVSCVQLHSSHAGARDAMAVPWGKPWLFTEQRNQEAPFLGGKGLSQTEIVKDLGKKCMWGKQRGEKGSEENHEISISLPTGNDYSCKEDENYCS